MHGFARQLEIALGEVKVLFEDHPVYFKWLAFNRNRSRGGLETWHGF